MTLVITDFIEGNKLYNMWVRSCVVHGTKYIWTFTNYTDSDLLFLGTCDNIAVLQAHAQAVTSVSHDMISLLGNRRFVILYILKYWYKKFYFKYLSLQMRSLYKK